ncbi:MULTISPECIES: homoserine kinase [unclassified Methanopyrus]|uniref:homoserine kinase n=1 Tax=Methanopyrus sp. SNP6 TaxID=1937005 RepID=UPI00143C6AD4|nr:homoserine kinase [Methanopyrus sp. SNP6]
MSTVVRAPATIANVGPGFDVFGLAVDGFHDVVKAREADGVRIVTEDSIPTDPERNTAGRVALRMVEEFDLPGVTLEIGKGVPVGGLGSSAASAVAAAVAIDREFGLGLEESELLRFAAEGERAAAGEPHYDNVAPCLLGGFVIWRSEREYRRLEVPGDLGFVTVTPIGVRVTTEEARRVLRERPPSLDDVVNNLSAVALMVAAIAEGDAETFARLIGQDRISEPVRRRFVPRYGELREAAYGAGALGFAISGAGPTVFAVCWREDAEDVKTALEDALSGKCVSAIHGVSEGVEVA